MRVEEALVLAWAREIAPRVAQDAVSRLQGITTTLSGDDSGLTNAWEEICVQVQGEESFLWSAYENTIDGCIEASLESLGRAELVALWASSEDSWAWFEDRHAENIALDNVPVDLDSVTKEVRSIVLYVAADFENERIYRALWGENEEPDGEGEDG